MSLGTLWAMLHEHLRGLVCFTEFASLNPVGDQLPGGGDPVRVKFHGTLTGFVGALEHGFATIRIVRIIVGTDSELFPRWRVGSIDFDYVLQHRNCILIRPGIVRQREAMQ